MWTCLVGLCASAAAHGVGQDPDLDPKYKVALVMSSLSSEARAARLRDDLAEAGIWMTRVASRTPDAPSAAASLLAVDLVLVDIPHGSVLESVALALQVEPAKTLPPLLPLAPEGVLGALGPAPTDTLGWAGEAVSAAGIRKVSGYWSNGGEANRSALVAAIAMIVRGDEASALTDLPEPTVIPEAGFYHPSWSGVAVELEDAIRRCGGTDRPLIAIALNRLTITSEDTAWVDVLIRMLEERGLTAYAFFGARKNPRLFTEMTCLGANGAARPVVDVIVNATLVFRANQRKDEIDKIGIPVIQTLPSLGMSEGEWRSSKEGLAQGDISFYLSSSELAGMVDPIIVSARDGKTGSLAPIESQCQALSEKIAAIVGLRRKARAERRVAFLVYNYPSGESNFGASFLNVPRSLVRVFGALGKGGYSVEAPKEDVIIEGVQGTMAGGGAGVEQGWLALGDYEAWFNRIPSSGREAIVAYWGEPAAAAEPRSHASYGDNTQGFHVPFVAAGNAIILPQPARFELDRGVDGAERKKRIGHRSTVPLNHRYLATYLWIRDEFGADAVVHFGTHGSVEWAPGKQRGLAHSDDPWLALGALPNVYPYIMDNLGEALTAKRRGRGVMVSHLTPMFTPAGFRPGLHDMHDVMHDWETVSEGAIRDELEKQLVQSFVEHGLDQDLATTPDEIRADFHGFMERLHPYLDDIAQTAQPQGLAVFGEVPSEKRRLGMIMQMLRKPLIDGLGEDIDEVFLLDAEKVPNSRPARWLRLALSDPVAASKLDLRQVDDLDTGMTTSVPNRARGKELNEDVLLALARRAQELDSALSENQEIASLLSALDGNHIPAAYGGDPVRNPDSLPTGRNLYGFDPSRVPTKQAYAVGRGVFESWLESYRIGHGGELPRSVAFSLWAGETMRHQGILESEAMHALGVRPLWDQGGRVVGTERIPISELGRERIDVVLSVTGSYRDQFPRLMGVLDAAVEGLASDPSEASEIRRATEIQAARLMQQGVGEKRAWSLASRRIFSNEPGAYGTGVNHVVESTELWDEQGKGGADREMADLFTARMGHVFGGGMNGEPAAGLLASALARVDAVMASRSSSTYGVLTSDDAFAYVGGLALAARLAPDREGDKAPEMYFQNMRDTSEVIIDPAARSLAKELQTRYLHPQWIKAQMDEGYSGTLQVLKAAEFVWGWQAVAPETVREDQWQSLFEVYVEDRYELGTEAWFQGDNPGAWAQVLSTMLDSVRLGYWGPGKETEEALVAAYQAASGELAAADLHEKVDAFARSVAAARERPSAAPKEPREPREVLTDSAPVRGQELTPVKSEDPLRTRHLAYLCGTALLMLVAIGAGLRTRSLRGSVRA